jgi:type IX secretion system PorP/SprF family membrane protein
MNNMRTVRWIPFVLLLGVAVRIKAQQDPMYTMYMWNTMAVNPGYAGSADLFTVAGLTRHQWVGLSGAPSTQTLTAHTPLPWESLGVGLSVVHDQVGPVNNTVAFVDIAYRIRVNDRARLAFGLKAGMDLMQLRLGSLQNVDASDPLFGQNITSKAQPNFGFGAYYWGKKGYIGVSAPKLLEHDRFESGASNNNAVSAVRQRRHYFLIGGYVFDFSRDVKFRPSVLVRAVEGAPVSADLSLMFLLREKLWLGGAYRNEDAVSAIIAYQITDQFKVGYAHDFTTSALRSYHSGTHELMLSYDLRFNKEKTLSPRYF